MEKISLTGDFLCETEWKCFFQENNISEENHKTEKKNPVSFFFLNEIKGSLEKNNTNIENISGEWTDFFLRNWGDIIFSCVKPSEEKKQSV